MNHAVRDTPAGTVHTSRNPVVWRRDRFLLRGMSAGWRQGADRAPIGSNVGRRTAKACRKTGDSGHP